MKKAFLAFTLLLGSMTALAAPSQQQINSSALEILIENSGRLTDQDGRSVANILSSQLVTGEETQNKISNTCRFDQNDELFNCSLMILNQDSDPANRTESSTEIRYQLEKDASGLPSGNLLFMSVEVVQAG